MHATLIDLLPEGVKSESLFKTEEECERWRADFIREVYPIQEEHRWRRAMSERDSMYHLID